jgi:zinc transporter ZupT
MNLLRIELHFLKNNLQHFFYYLCLSHTKQTQVTGDKAEPVQTESCFVGRKSCPKEFFDCPQAKTKLVVVLELGGLFVLAMIGGLLPLFLSSPHKPGSVFSRTCFSVSVLFAGGVMLGACFFHLLPEAREQLATLSSLHEEHEDHSRNQHEHRHTISISDALCMSTLLLLFFLDQLTHSHHHHSRHENAFEFSPRSTQFRTRGDGDAFELRTAAENSDSSGYDNDQTPLRSNRVRQTGSPSSGSAVLLLVSLCVHSLLEGTALGVSGGTEQHALFGSSRLRFVLLLCILFILFYFCKISVT